MNEVDEIIVSSSRLRRIYSKPRLIKDLARRNGRRFVQSIAMIEDNGIPKEFKQNIESNLEWFLTWRLKYSVFPEPMWCDGTKIQNLIRTNEREFKLEAKIKIGPENGCDKLSWCEMTGLFTVKRNLKNFKSYCLSIQDRGNIYSLRKAT